MPVHQDRWSFRYIKAKLGTFLKPFWPSCNFPRVFYHVALQLPNRAISQVATSKVCFGRSARPLSLFKPTRSAPKHSLAAGLGLHYSLRRLRRPNLSFWKLPSRNYTKYESCCWENTLGKLPLGKRPEGKYLTIPLKSQ